MMRPRVLLVSPLHGAVSGQNAVTQMVVDSPLSSWWEIAHLEASTAKSNADRARVSWIGLARLSQLLWTLRRALKEFRPQAVWIPLARNRSGLLKFSLLAALCFRHGVRVIAKVGGDDFNLFHIAQSRAAQDIIQAVLGKCAAVLVEAQCLTRQFAGIVPAERLRWAHLGIDAAPYVPPLRSRPARSVLFVGHVTQAKGAVDLLAAMPAVSKAIPGARLVMLGEHVRRERSLIHLHDRDAGWRAVKAREANVEAPGILTGPAKRHAFAEADVFCLPSASEGFPVSVLEAMAAGLPLVVTPVGALPEILVDGVGCWFVPYGHPEQLAKVLSELLSPEYRFGRQRMGAENRRAVEERFTLERFADGVRLALKDVVEG